ncbi:MAG: hypothetical protein ACK5LJ_06410 [Paracoccus sp. (in: a-proteobacteria)]
MPFVIILALAALAIWYLWRQGGLRGRKCRWALIDDRRALKEFRCESCGVTAYSQSGHGPRECKRNLRSSL